MAIDKNEKRRFLLWGISRANSQVTPGPNELFPVQVDRKTSKHLPAVCPVVFAFLGRAIPSKKVIASGLAVVFVLSVFYSLVSPAAVARRVIRRAGGVAHESYTSRFVFHNASLKPTDVMSLIPYLRNVPPSRDLQTLPRCVVLDFSATPQIDDKTVLELVRHLEHTIVFYGSSQGDRWRASDDMGQEMLRTLKRNNLVGLQR